MLPTWQAEPSPGCGSRSPCTPALPTPSSRQAPRQSGTPCSDRISLIRSPRVGLGGIITPSSLHLAMSSSNFIPDSPFRRELVGVTCRCSINSDLSSAGTPNSTRAVVSSALFHLPRRGQRAGLRMGRGWQAVEGHRGLESSVKTAPANQQVFEPARSLI